MGLSIDITDFELWYGGYGGFMTLRKVIRKTYCEFCRKQLPIGLTLFLNHSDCDGTLPWTVCLELSDTLYEILPHITEDDAWGHIIRNGGMKKCVEQLAKGFKKAYEQQENPRFS